MACGGRTLVWWDRDIDAGGRRIRPDARLAAHEIWRHACQRATAVLADPAAAPELMENAVAQVSRYLDRIGAPLCSRKHGLVMVAFCRGLRRQAAKLGRLELAGGPNEMASYANRWSWLEQTDARLDLDRIIRRLNEPSATVLMLRAAGFEWKEVASLLGTTAAAARNNFWREIAVLRRGFDESGPGS
ncbi:MAG TPA: hypothetical protein VGS27_17595 [Candidatus Sulfotelmatobacter sp.]|nr:hypothetical protein [Candidatus Sulfotelmatobacter sp.]